jgi:wee1-like protein kinase
MMNPNSTYRLSARQCLEDPYLYIKKENYIKWEKMRGF